MTNTSLNILTLFETSHITKCRNIQELQSIDQKKFTQKTIFILKVNCVSESNELDMAG
jgi:hypothetical protein